MNSLVSELANVAAEERAMIDEFEALLVTTAAMQVRKVIKMSIHFSSSKNRLPLVFHDLVAHK